MTSDDNIWKEILEREKTGQVNALNELAEIAKILRPAGYRMLKFMYSGSGDSGAIDEYEVTHDRLYGSELVDDPNFPHGTVERVQELMYHFLPGGWETNEGGQGTVEFDIETGTITVNHGFNETKVNEETRMFKAGDPKTAKSWFLGVG